MPFILFSIAIILNFSLLGFAPNNPTISKIDSLSIEPITLNINSKIVIPHISSGDIYLPKKAIKPAPKPKKIIKPTAPLVNQSKPIISKPAQTENWEGRIDYWCGIYKCNRDQLIRVMYCESGARTNASNPSGASGLFQFMPGTFKGNAKRINLVDANIWNGEHQTQVAAYMFSIGQARQWSCK